MSDMVANSPEADGAPDVNNRPAESVAAILKERFPEHGNIVCERPVKYGRNCTGEDRKKEKLVH